MKQLLECQTERRETATRAEKRSRLSRRKWIVGIAMIEQWWSDGRRRSVRNVNRHNSACRFVNTHCPSRTPGCLRADRDDSRTGTADMSDCFPPVFELKGGGGTCRGARRKHRFRIQTFSARPTSVRSSRRSASLFVCANYRRVARIFVHIFNFRVKPCF